MNDSANYHGIVRDLTLGVDVFAKLMPETQKYCQYYSQFTTQLSFKHKHGQESRKFLSQ